MKRLSHVGVLCQVSGLWSCIAALACDLAQKVQQKISSLCQALAFMRLDSIL